MNSAEIRRMLAGATVAGPASEELVRSAEDRLSLKFPGQYREFLKSYGAALGSGFEIAGVFNHSGSEPPLWRDVVSSTERFRRSVGGKLPDFLVPISDNGCGVTFYVIAIPSQESEFIIAFGPGIDGKVVAENFIEFVRKLVEDDLGA